MQRLMTFAGLLIALATCPAFADETTCIPSKMSQDEYIACATREAHLEARAAAETDRVFRAQHPDASVPGSPWSLHADNRLDASVEDREAKAVLTLSCDERKGFELQVFGLNTFMDRPEAIAYIMVDGTPPVEMPVSALLGRRGEGPILFHAAEKVERSVLKSKQMTIRIVQRHGVDAFKFGTAELAKGAARVLEKCPAP